MLNEILVLERRKYLMIQFIIIYFKMIYFGDLKILLDMTVLFVCLFGFGFYGISTFVVYLMPNRSLKQTNSSISNNSV